jgi:hypothetical protein
MSEPLKGYLTAAHEAAFMGLDDRGCCRRCDFWKEHEGPTYINMDGKLTESDIITDNSLSVFTQHTGNCCRNPPQFAPPQMPEMDPFQGVWPATSWLNGCGEYRANKRGEG